MRARDKISMNITEQIAEYEGVDPANLHPPLYESIDMDALESLITSSSTDSMQISFTYNGYLVRVDSTNTVHVSKPCSDAVAPRVDA